jgi:hypothetical protein
MPSSPCFRGGLANVICQSFSAMCQVLSQGAEGMLAASEHRGRDMAGPKPLLLLSRPNMVSPAKGSRGWVCRIGPTTPHHGLSGSVTPRVVGREDSVAGPR